MTKKVLGIDFGTAYTYICQYDGQVYQNVGETFATGTTHTKASVLKKSPGIPTLIGVAIDNKMNKEEWIVGKSLKNILDKQGAVIKNEEAYKTGWKMGSIEYENTIVFYCDNLKQLLCEPSLPLNGASDVELFYGRNYEKSITVIDLANKFFKTIISQDIYNTSDTIAVGIPGKQADDKLEKYKVRIQQIFKEEKAELVIVEEPVAAAVAYCKYNKMPPGNFLVIDMGGGTSDFSIICQTDENFSLVDTDGNNHPAGNNLDESITKSVDINDSSKNLKMEVTEAKEKLFSLTGGEDAANFAYNGKTIFLTCKRNNSESKKEKVVNILGNVNKFAEEISENINKWKKSLSNGKNNSNELNGILYVGGTSNISKLREEIKKLLNLSKIEDYYFTDQKVLDMNQGKGKEIELTYANAVAVGAALYAFNSISQSANSVTAKKYRIKSAYKLELKLPEKTGKTVDWKVKATLLDKEMIFAGNMDSKGPCLIKKTSETPNIIDFKIVKEGREYPEGDKVYNVNTGGKDICIFADWNEKKQEPIIYVCATDALDSGYQYVCELNNGDQLLISSKKERIVPSEEVDWCYKCIPGKDDSMSFDRISLQVGNGWKKR